MLILLDHLHRLEEVGIHSVGTFGGALVTRVVTLERACADGLHAECSTEHIEPSIQFDLADLDFGGVTQLGERRCCLLGALHGLRGCLLCHVIDLLLMTVDMPYYPPIG